MKQKNCCLNCQFYGYTASSFSWTYDKKTRQEFLKLINDRRRLSQAISDSENNNINGKYSKLICDHQFAACTQGVWRSNFSIKLVNNVMRKRYLNECFFIDFVEGRNLDTSKELQKIQRQERENKRQWLITIYALYITLVASFDSIIVNLFKDYFSIYQSILFIILNGFVILWIYLLMKRKFWRKNY